MPLWVLALGRSPSTIAEHYPDHYSDNYHWRRFVSKADTPRASAIATKLLPSPVARIQKYAARYGPEFDILSDAQEDIFAAYQSKTSWMGELRTAANLPKVIGTLASAPNNPLAVDGKFNRMPSEFLIDAEGNVSRAFYVRAMDDGLALSDVLDWARGVA